VLDFLVIGAQKAGTTWLNRKLRKHHQKISFPGGKEVHFWDLFRARGTDWYVNLFAKPDGRLHGEMTPAYAVLPPEVIAECHGLFPNLRLIYTLRDPAERAWSAAKMDAVQVGMQVADVPDEWFLSRFRSAESLARGDYETCIRNWLRFYRKDQLLVLRFEEILNDPASYLGKCFNHLGLETIYAPKNSISAGLDSKEEEELRAKVREGSPEPLRPSLQPVLRELYDFKIRSLSEYLGEDFSDWLAWDGERSGTTL
jgi:hypothetical protein